MKREKEKMAAMTCVKFTTILPDMLLDPANLPDDVFADARRHMAECSTCSLEWLELQSVMQRLDDWTVPEPGPYFDTRMAAQLRAAKALPAPGFLEKLRARFLLSGGIQFRPAMAAAAALLLISGVGSYEGFVSLNRTHPATQTVSATVTDLELLDSNAQTLQQMSAFDDPDASMGQDAGTLNPAR